MADAFQMSQNLNKSIMARTESLKASQTVPEAPQGLRTVKTSLNKGRL